MEPFSTPLILLATVSCTFMAVRAVRRGSLTKPAACVGFVTGFVMVGSGLRGFLLFGFYVLASKATRYKAQCKSKLSQECSETTTRNAMQVLCVSGMACLLTVYHAFVYGAERPFGFSSSSFCFASAITAHHATSLADTLASELGMIVANSPPRLITQPWRQVPRGCNGGVTMVGFMWSAVGGAIIGMMTVVLDFLSGILLQPVRVVVFCTLMGLAGSVLDSILGATVQPTYWDEKTKQIVHKGGSRLAGFDLLSNEVVNLVSTALVTVIGGWIVGPSLFATQS